ncbi:MAG: glycosyltransferase family 4 protein [Acidimicrobiales bacterium]|nr:glycosyltransferase family 4 protein [Acidimicrobiales bacterium]
MTRSKMLVVAYDCIPNAGSDPGLGWQAAQLAARDHQTWVLTKASNRAAIEAAQTPPNIEWVYIHLPEKVGPLQTGAKWGDTVHCYFWLRRAMRAASKIHKEHGLDITQYASFSAFWMPVPLVRLGVPHIFGPVTGGEWTPEALAPRGFRARIDDLIRRTLQELGMRTPNWRRMAESESTVMVAATPVTANRLRAAGAKNAVVFRPPFSLDTAQIEQARRYPPSDPDSVRFVMSGRQLHWKGHQLGIEAFAQVVAARHDAHLDLIGTGPEHDRLVKLVDDLGLRNSVTVHGAMHREQEREHISRATALVFPSHRDAGGTLPILSMAIGTVVIALKTGAVPATLGDAGVLVDVWSREQIIADLAQEMIAIATDHARREMLIERGLERVRTQFSLDQAHDHTRAWTQTVRSAPVVEPAAQSA